VVVLSKAGVQIPVIFSSEVTGKADSNSPEQIGETAAKVGVTGSVTTIESD